MERAKSFKWANALWILLLIPLLFVFTACGDNTPAVLKTQATCNTSGAYATAATQEDFDAAIGTQTAIDAEGFRITMKGKQDGADVYGNMVVKGEEFMMQVKGKNPDTGKTESVLFFYTDGKIYFSMKYEGKTYKVYMDVDMDEAMEEYGAGEFMDSESILAAVAKVQSKLDVAKQGNNYKFTLKDGESFVQDGATITKAVAYFNFNENNKLTALQMTYEGTDEDQGSMKATVTMSGFSGNIEFPDLSDYKDMLDPTVWV